MTFKSHWRSSEMLQFDKAHDFPSPLHSNYGPILYPFPHIARNCSKIVKFIHPTSFTVPLGGEWPCRDFSNVFSTGKTRMMEVPVWPSGSGGLGSTPGSGGLSVYAGQLSAYSDYYLWQAQTCVLLDLWQATRTRFKGARTSSAYQHWDNRSGRLRHYKQCTTKFTLFLWWQC